MVAQLNQLPNGGNKNINLNYPDFDNFETSPVTGKMGTYYYDIGKGENLFLDSPNHDHLYYDQKADVKHAIAKTI